MTTLEFRFAQLEAAGGFREATLTADGERAAGRAEQRAAEQEDAEHRDVVGVAVESRRRGRASMVIASAHAGPVMAPQRRGRRSDAALTARAAANPA